MDYIYKQVLTVMLNFRNFGLQFWNTDIYILTGLISVITLYLSTRLLRPPGVHIHPLHTAEICSSTGTSRSPHTPPHSAIWTQFQDQTRLVCGYWGPLHTAAVCTPPAHPQYPTSHHTLSPTSRCGKPPAFLHSLPQNQPAWWSWGLD